MTGNPAGQLTAAPQPKKSIRSRRSSESDAATPHTEATEALRRVRSMPAFHYPEHSVNRPLIPRPMSRDVFRVDPYYASHDIAARAIVDITQPLDLSADIQSAESTLLAVCDYRTHPGAYNLTKCLGSRVKSREQIKLAFPEKTGEVMYVIHPCREVIIAARSGNQRDLPHPTLIGGLDPEALSAGLVFFRDGRIVRVFINASGHFKPKGWSSVEVSLAAFSRLAPEAFHPEFEGYRVFCHGQREGVPFLGPAPRIGNRFAPFLICDIPDAPGAREETRALARTAAMHDMIHALKMRTTKGISGILIMSLTNRSEDPVIFALMDFGMKARYARILRAVQGAPVERQTTRVITEHDDFRPLLKALTKRQESFRKDAAAAVGPAITPA